MTRSRWMMIAAVLAVAAIAPAHAKAVFLSQAQYDPALLLPPPPADGSAAAKAELAEIQALQSHRTPEQLARAKSDDTTENATIFAGILGPAFNLDKLPATAKMLKDVRNDEKEAAAAAKDFFKRNRPWIVDPKLKSCSKEDAPQSSYPSGHATMGYSMGIILAALVPEKSQAILARAAEYSENRLVCGMHFRRDIEAGQVLGMMVGLTLMRDTGFHAEYEAAAAELRAANITK